MKPKLKWCLLNHYSIFYCRAYSSKKGAKYNLRVVQNHPLLGEVWKDGFFVAQRYVYDD